ncbi:MAG TPA: PKD-like family lipoprotein [Chitinophagaceae bacterium]|nr:PKD-like family lipoprotein [Chitinophagaceae bacterium]
MKQLNILVLVVTSAFLVTSCYKDKGNYSFSEKEVITVTGIATSYDKVSQQDRITLTPSVSSSMPNASFEYYWGIYETNVQGAVPKIDTIAKTLNIDYFVAKPAKTWVLVFGAKNKTTGLQKIVTANINVITPFTRGWYVLKDDGNKTDMDLFLTPASIVPASKISNVFSFVNGKQLNGKAMSLNFEPTYKSTVTGVLNNTRALFIASDKDASVIDINTLTEIHDFAGMFYNAPVVKAPTFIGQGSQADYFVNGGQLYSLYSSSSNIGLFAARQLKDAQNTDYYLSRYFINYQLANPIFFDETSSSFISAGGAGTVLNGVTDAVGTAMKANNNNKTILYMGLKSTTPTGVALMQDKTNPSLKILSAITANTSAFNMVNDTLLNSSMLYNASMATCNLTDENLLYFVVGNQVWSRNLSNKFEQLQYTAPAGETITYIRHKKYTSEAAYAHNYIAIATTSGGNYTVRMFTKTSGNLAAAPDVTLTGAGSVGDIIYMSPSVGQYTYYPSY